MLAYSPTLLRLKASCNNGNDNKTQAAGKSNKEIDKMSNQGESAKNIKETDTEKLIGVSLCLVKEGKRPAKQNKS